MSELWRKNVDRGTLTFVEEFFGDDAFWQAAQHAAWCQPPGDYLIKDGGRDVEVSTLMDHTVLMDTGELGVCDGVVGELPLYAGWCEPLPN